MLDSIRRSANKFAIRLLLGIIALAFIGWGIKDALQQQNNYDIVTFDKAQNISENNFYQATAEEISFIQKQNQANLTEEDIKQLGINKIVLNRLITKNILKDIGNRYELKLSEESVLNFLKKARIFEDSKGNFDYEALKASIKNSNVREQEYFTDLEQKILQNVLVTTFSEAFVVPKIMIKSINNYLNEERSVELVETNLKNSQQDSKLPTPNESQISEFYQKHKELFTTKELRDIEYLKLSAKEFKNKIITSKEELKSFYDDNKEEFGSDSFDKIELQILDIVNQKKIDQFMTDFNKDLEEDVAAGMSVGEIAKKHQVQVLVMNNTTYEDIADQNSVMNIIADAIFEMNEGETLYPTEIKEDNELIVVEVKSIKLAKLEPFEEVKGKAEKLLSEKITIHNNLNKFEEISKNYVLERTSRKQINNFNNIGIKINQAKFIRSKIDDTLKLPQALVDFMFEVKEGAITKVVRFDDKAYFAYINQITISDDVASDHDKTVSTKDQIVFNINNSLIESLINYYIKENNMKINFKDPVLKEDQDN
ncbi:MAG: hypothetical protein EOP33_00665 [Rickettsiaceae bacterium]|nr:MAG: hypothetical protein EOP33_00665 [Rickettsiaceae bacterium]